MIWVLLWLASGALVAVGATLRLGASLSNVLRARVGLWGPVSLVVIGLLAIALDIGRQFDGSDPLELVPSLATWAFIAVAVAAINPRLSTAAVFVFAAGQILTIRFLAGPAEILVYSSAYGRVAWLGDKATLLEGVVRQAFTAVWGGALDYPSAPVISHLMALLVWGIPVAAVLLVAGSAWLLRASAAGESTRRVSVRPFDLWALALLLPGAFHFGTWLGTVGLVIEDLGRTAYLVHLLATAMWLRRIRIEPLDGAAVPAWLRLLARGATVPAITAALVVMPDVGGVLLGLVGVIARGLGVVASPAVRVYRETPRNSHHGPLAWPALAALAAVFVLLHQFDFTATSPQSGRMRGGAGTAIGEAGTAAAAATSCRARGAQVCSLGDWRRSARVGSGLAPGFASGRWEWVQIPSADASIPGLAQVIDAAGGTGIVAVAAVLQADIGADRATVRCCSGPLSR